MRELEDLQGFCVRADALRIDPSASDSSVSARSRTPLSYDILEEYKGIVCIRLISESTLLGHFRIGLKCLPGAGRC
jgi:hypothetical protein